MLTLDAEQARRLGPPEEGPSEVRPQPAKRPPRPALRRRLEAALAPARHLGRAKAEPIVSRRMSAPPEGTLRMIATFVAAFGIGVATYIAIADSGGGSPVCLAGGSGCETVANSTYSHLLGVNIAVFGIVGYVLLLAASLLRGDAARMAGFGVSPGRLRLQRLPHLPGAVQDRGDLPVVRGERRADDGPLRPERDPHGRLRWDRMSGRLGSAPRRAAAGRNASRGAPQATAADRQRRGLSGDRRGGGADRDQPERQQRRRHQPRGRRPGQARAAGDSAERHGARRSEGEGDAGRVRRPPVPGLQRLLRRDRPRA